MTNENLPIDPSMLDEEWMQQPLLFDEAQEVAADCLDTRDTLKRELIELEADRSSYIRDEEVWQKEGFKKAPAQAAVDEWVIKRGEVVEAKKGLHTAQMALVRANNTVESLLMRRKALEKLCDLHISNYFSVPNPGHILTDGKRYIDAQNQKAEEGSKKASEALNEKKQSRKSKEEVLENIKNPDTQAEARKRIEDEENTGIEEGMTGPPKRRRRR